MRCTRAAGVPDEAPALLRWLTRFGLAGAGQACRALALSPAGGRRLLCRLEAAGWVRRWRVVRGEDDLLAPTRRGMAASGSKPGPARIDLRRYDQGLAAVDLAQELCGAAATAWRTARELRPAWGPSPASGRLGLPDGLAASLGGRPCLVAVELAVRTPADVRRRAEAWREASGVEAVRLYVLPGLAERYEAAVGWLPGIRVLPWQPPHLVGRAPFAAGAGGLPAAPLVRADLHLVGFLSDFGLATAAQVARAVGLPSGQVHGRLARLRAVGWVRRARVWSGWPAVHLATARGCAACGGELAPARLDLDRCHHTLALVELAWQLQAETGGRWTAERRLAVEYARRHGFGRLAVPDGRLELPGGRRIAVQLELKRQPRHALMSCVARLRAAAAADGVLYLVTPRHEAVYRRFCACLDGAEVRLWKSPWGRPRHLDPQAPRDAIRRRRRA